MTTPFAPLKKYGFVPDKLVTDDLRSYRAAASDLGIAKRQSAADGATIERRSRINQPEGNARCKGSRAWDPRKDFSQCMQQPTTHSTPNVISPPQERTEPSGHRLCRRGVKSSLRREPDVPGDLLRAIFGNVTEPEARPAKCSAIPATASTALKSCAFTDLIQDFQTTPSVGSLVRPSTTAKTQSIWWVFALAIGVPHLEDESASVTAPTGTASVLKTVERHLRPRSADSIKASGHSAASTGRTHDRKRPRPSPSRSKSPCMPGAIHT
jgi:hypothetical protein